MIGPICIFISCFLSFLAYCIGGQIGKRSVIHSEKAMSLKCGTWTFFICMIITLVVFAWNDSLEGTVSDTKQPSSQVAEAESEESSLSVPEKESEESIGQSKTLAEKIQCKILDKYDNTVITNFNVSDYTGSFLYNYESYDFSWQDDMLEINKSSNPDDAVYYKITK